MPSNFVSLYFLINLCTFFSTVVAIYYPTAKAKLREFPETVAVIAEPASEKKVHVVGTGTLLTPYYVLSYGYHSFPFKRIYVLAGGLHWRKWDCRTCQLREVKHIFKTRREEERVKLEIYRVNKDFKATREVRFARLNYDLPRHDWLVHVAGWGHVYREDGYSTPFLHWHSFRIISNKDCADLPNPPMWGDYFCFYSNRTPNRPSKLLAYDSGAPVYRFNVVIGIAVPLRKGLLVFTTAMRLGVYQEWISRTIAWDGQTPNPNAILMNRRLKHRGLSSGYSLFCRSHFDIGVFVSWLINSMLILM